MTRDIKRGTRGILSPVTFTLYNILPTIVEVGLVIGYLLRQYDIQFSVITAATLAIYIFYTVTVTNWRNDYRRAVNELDSETNSKATDSIINFETVNYFGNEDYEARICKDGLQRLETAALNAADLHVTGAEVTFSHVDFSYSLKRQIFTISTSPSRQAQQQPLSGTVAPEIVNGASAFPLL
jgi:ABC-type multidrug transport system fused ATPase/permease subunit